MNPQRTFDSKMWMNNFSPAELDQHSLNIVSPSTLCTHLQSVSQLRQWLETIDTKFDIPCFPTDVFTFGLGSPDAPWHSKVGGPAYRQRSKPWPIWENSNDDSVQPLNFLGQIYLGDSLDILPQGIAKQGDMLLVFSDLYNNFHWEWGRSDDENSCLVNGPDGVLFLDEFFGVRCRTWDFPNLGPNPNLIASGFKIGGYCPGMDGPWDSDDCEIQFEKMIIANFSPFCPVRHRYPFVNVEAPWGGSADQTYQLYNWSADFTGVATTEEDGKTLTSIEAKAYGNQPWCADSANPDLSDYL